MRLLAELSSVGWESSDQVTVTIDGEPQVLDGIFDSDRNFYSLNLDRIHAGQHTLQAAEVTHDHNNVVGSVRVYALPATYDDRPDAIGAYATYSAYGGLSGYRPSHKMCIMRDMLSTRFCPIDQENMWRRFISETGLIDRVVVSKSTQGWQAEVSTPALKGLGVYWEVQTQNGQWSRLESADHQHLIEIPASSEFKKLKATAVFVTPEVRNPAEGFRSTREVTLP